MYTFIENFIIEQLNSVVLISFNGHYTYYSLQIVFCVNYRKKHFSNLFYLFIYLFLFKVYI